MEEFKAEGTFWLPEKPEDPFEGVLKISSTNSPALEVDRSKFIALAHQLGRTVDIGSVKFLSGALHFDVICGYVGDRAISLLDCWGTYLDPTFSIRAAFFGAHFRSGQDAIFDEMTFRYSHLENWLGISGFSGTMSDNKNMSALKIKLKYEQPKRTIVRLDHLTLAFTHSLSFGIGTFPEFNFRQYTSVTFRPQQPLQFTDFQVQITKPFRHFLCLALGQPVLTESVYGKSRRNQRRMRHKEGRENPIEIHYFPTGGTLKPLKWHQVNPLFTFSKVKDHLAQYLQAWYQKHQRLNAAMELYFGLLYGPKPLPRRFEFLALLQVFEAYHRDGYDGAYLSPEDFEELKNTLIAAIPATIDRDYKKALKDRLTHINEYSLRKRLKDVFLRILAPYHEHVEFLTKNPRDFADEVTDMRNAATHPSTERDDVFDHNPRKVDNHIRRLKMLFALCLLREMDFPPEIVSNLLAKHLPYRQLRNL